MTAQKERDELLENLLLAAGDLLSGPQIYTVAGDELTGTLALRDGAIEREHVAYRRLSLKNISVVCRCAELGLAYIGPVPETDPCVNLCSSALLGRGLVVAPVTIAGRTVCLLLGHPRARVTRELRDQILELAREVSLELGKLAARRKHEQGAAEPGGAPEQGLTNPYGHPAIGAAKKPAPEREGLTSPYGHPAVGGAKKPAPEREGATSPYGHPAIGKQRAGAPVSEPPAPEPEVVLLTQPKAKPEPERRRYPRLALCVQVSHLSEHNFFTSFSEDVSEGGLFIATHSVLPVGDRFELELALPGQPAPWIVPCEVRWLRVYETASKLVPGMGVHFLELTPEMREQIRRFMDKRPPLHHEG